MNDGGACFVSRTGVVTEGSGTLLDAVGRRLVDVLPWVESARVLLASGVTGVERVRLGEIEASLQIFDGGAANVVVRSVGALDVVDASRCMHSCGELEEMLAQLPVAVFVARDGHIVTANRAMSRLLGRESSAELVGWGVDDVLAPEERAAATDYRKRLVRGEKVEPRIWRAIRADGTAIFIEGLGGQAIHYEGSPAVVWTVRDVTELRNLQSQLVHADRLASIGALAAGVAHEMNNPLSFVCASVDYLDEILARVVPGLPLTEQRELAELMGELRMGTERVRKIVGELKQLSRTDPEARAPLEVEGVVDLAIRMTHAETRHRARVIREYGSCPRVLADETRLGQVFLNLLVNAAQALPEGRASQNEIRVRIGTTAEGWAAVEISDTGAGIPPEVLDHIFDPFFTTKPVGLGTGLGLAICRTTIERLGGTIQVSNLPGGGASFRIVLPPCDEPLETVGAAPEESMVRVRRHRILVVDDDVAAGRAVMRALARDHQVELLGDAREALSCLLGGAHFDLIVCDVMMPELSGPDLHERVRGALGTRAPPFLFVTGGALTPKTAAFLAGLAEAQIEKPFDVAVLRRLVSERLAATDRVG